MRLEFQPIADRHVAMVEDWLQDAESRRRLGGMIPFRPCFEYQQRSPGYHEWIVYDGGVPVGLAGFEIGDDDTAAVVVLVPPERRGQGYGASVLKALCSRPEAQGVSELVASVEPDHRAAIRCAQAAGFVDTGPDPDDAEFLRFVRKRQQ